MHTVEDRDGMRVLVVTSMQDLSSMQSGSLEIIEGNKLEEPTAIVHANDIAKYYGLDIRDVWPLVHANAMGQRVSYNSTPTEDKDSPTPGKPILPMTKNSNRNERYWVDGYDTHGNKTKVERVRRVPYVQEPDDGVYAKYTDVLYFADSQGWTKGGGKPKSKEAQQTTSDLSVLSQQIAELTKLMTMQVQLSLDEKKARK
jgi:hypothetical protein